MKHLCALLSIVVPCCATDFGIAVVLEYSDTPHGSTAVAAANLAVEELNRDTVLTQGGKHKLVLTSIIVNQKYPEANEGSTGSGKQYGPDSFNKNWVGNDYYMYASLVDALQARPQALVIGPYFSAVALDLRVHGDYFQVPMITPAATDPFITVGSEYFFQPIKGDDHHSEFFQQLMKRLEIKRVAVIYTKDADGVNGVQHFLSRCLENGVTLLGSFAIQQNKPDNIKAALQRFKSNGATVFFLVADKQHATSILGEAHSMGLLSLDYIWMMQGLSEVEPDELGPVFQNVLTDGIFDNDIISKDFLAKWSSPMARAFPPAGMVEPFKSTVAVYDIAMLAGKAILQVADQISDGGHQLGTVAPFTGSHHKWQHGPLLRNVLREIKHVGLTNEIEFDDHRLSGWKVKGSQLVWNSTELSAVPSGEVSGEGHDWNAAKGVFRLDSLTWNRSNIAIPNDRPPLSAITAQVVISLSLWPFCHLANPQESNTTEGFACDIFKLLQDQLGFAANITLGNYTDFELISMIARGEADMVVGHIALHPAITGFSESKELETLIFNNVEYTHPYWTDGIVAVGRVSDATQTYDLWHFVGPFASDMWLLWFGWVVFAGFLFYVFERKDHEDLAEVPVPEGLAASLWFSFTASLACQDMTPKTYAGKISSWALFFVTMLVIAAYTANLAAFLVASTGSNGPEITDIGVTILPNQVGVETGSVAMDVLSAQTNGGTYFESIVTEQLSEKVMNSELKMLVEESPIAEYLVNEWGTTRGCPLRTFGSKTGQVSYALAVRRQWGYAAELSRRLVKITSGQDIAKTDIKGLYHRYFTSGVCPVTGPVASSTQKITAADMGGAFVGYAIAVGLAFVVYIVEQNYPKDTNVTEIEEMRETATLAMLHKKIDTLLENRSGAMVEEVNTVDDAKF